MRKLFFIQFLVIPILLLWQGCSKQHIGIITPNQFQGSDIERIQAAIDKAAKTTNRVVIPPDNSDESGKWLIDSAILLPSNISVILKNCTIQLSDSSRDNMFRSDNVGIGITDPAWNYNISIIGIGRVVLKGAKDPRATGDARKKLSLTPTKDVKETGNYHISYGSDASRKGVKQTGDWRDILILMAYVKGFTLRNVIIKDTHGWAISNERVVNAKISHIRFHSLPFDIIDSTKKIVRNRDGIHLRFGCKNFRINNVSGRTGDDFIALSALEPGDWSKEAGSLHSMMVTADKWRGAKDNIENIYITNIVAKSDTRAIAIRANGEASINHVYINGVMFKGGHNAVLFSGRGYGAPSKPGKINHIYAMNIMGGGDKSLIQIDAPIADCSFVNSFYFGDGEQIILYNIKKDETRNIVVQNIGSIRNIPL